jgi:hypothetical protein
VSPIKVEKNGLTYNGILEKFLNFVKGNFMLIGQVRDVVDVSLAQEAM